MLDGLYHLSAGDHERALGKLARIRAVLNERTRLLDYPALRAGRRPLGVAEIRVR